MALLGCALLSVVAIASAIAPCAPRCGCNGGPALAVRHHKSGTVLAQKMMVSLERACGMKTAKLPFRDVGAFAASASGCETAYTYLPASRCNDSCVDAAFAAARGRVRVLHMVREPLALVVSTYLYHKGGKEPTFGRPPLAPRLKKASVRAGLRMAADETLRRALPAMVGFHEKRPGATFRLEDLAGPHGFGAFTAAFLTQVGFDRKECARPVQRELAGHDTARWTAKAKRRSSHLSGSANTSHLRSLLVASPAYDALRRFGARLGYRYARDGAASVVR